MKHGLDRYRVGLPSLQCAHITRQNLLDCVLKHAHPCYKWWLARSSAQLEAPSEAVLRIMVEGLDSIPLPMMITMKLSHLHDRCIVCCKHTRINSDSDPRQNSQGEHIFHFTV